MITITITTNNLNIITVKTVMVTIKTIIIIDLTALKWNKVKRKKIRQIMKRRLDLYIIINYYLLYIYIYILLLFRRKWKRLIRKH
jgi:uncharacterized membrane protein YidH (DUF202 family)